MTETQAAEPSFWVVWARQVGDLSWDTRIYLAGIGPFELCGLREPPTEAELPMLARALALVHSPPHTP